MVQLYLFPGDLDLERVGSHDSFSKIPTVRDRFLINILEIFKGRNQKGVDWYIFHIFSYFFRCWPNFPGIKHLYHHFWKFCLLELIKEINRNSSISLSTNSDAFWSLKKLVSKFDDFVCLQLYKNWVVNTYKLLEHHVNEYACKYFWYCAVCN